MVSEDGSFSSAIGSWDVQTDPVMLQRDVMGRCDRLRGQLQLKVHMQKVRAINTVFYRSPA